MDSVIAVSRLLAKKDFFRGFVFQSYIAYLLLMHTLTYFSDGFRATQNIPPPDVSNLVSTVLELSAKRPIVINIANVQDLINLDKAIMAVVKQEGYDCSQCLLLSMYKKSSSFLERWFYRDGVSVSSALDLLPVQQVTCVAKVTQLLDSMFSILSEDDESDSARSIVSILSSLGQCSPFSVRFVATLVCVSLMHKRPSHATTEELRTLVELRTRDINPFIRQLAGIDGLLRIGDESILKSIMYDPDVHVRERFLNELRSSSWLMINKFSADSIRTLGDWLIKQCFITANPKYSVSAFNLLTKSECLLGDDEDTFQYLANLVWVACPSKKRKRNEPDWDISIAALEFIDKHILGFPGLFAMYKTHPVYQRMLMLVEFIEQYSDGLVYPLTRRIVRAIFKTRGNQENFLSEPDVYVTCLKNCAVRPKLQSADSPPVDFLQVKRRLNVFLELLLESYSLLNPGVKGTFNKCLGLFEELARSTESDSLELDFDRMDNLCGSDSQTQVVGEGLKQGIKVRRHNYEVIREFMHAVANEDSFLGDISNRQSLQQVHEKVVDHVHQITANATAT